MTDEKKSNNIDNGGNFQDACIKKCNEIDAIFSEISSKSYDIEVEISKTLAVLDSDMKRINNILDAFQRKYPKEFESMKKMADRKISAMKSDVEREIATVSSNNNFSLEKILVKKNLIYTPA